MLLQAVKRRFSAVASSNILQMLNNDAALYSRIASDLKHKYYVLRLINSDNATLRVDNA